MGEEALAGAAGGGGGGLMAGLGIAGAAVSAAGLVIGLFEAAEQRRKMRELESETKSSIFSAIKDVQKNRAEEIGINLEGIQDQKDVAVRGAKQELEAKQEADTCNLQAQATFERLNQVGANIRDTVGDKLTLRDEAIAEEAKSDDETIASIKLAESAGQAQAAAQADQNRATALTGALKSGLEGARAIDDISELYKQNNNNTTPPSPETVAFVKNFMDSQKPTGPRIGNATFGDQFALPEFQGMSLSDQFRLVTGQPMTFGNPNLFPTQQDPTFGQKIGKGINVGLDALSDFTGIGDGQPFDESILGQFFGNLNLFGKNN